MIEVHPNLFVGNALAWQDLEPQLSEENPVWWVLHAAKAPWHKQMVGHQGYACPKDHPEYLFARRGQRMALNMIDVDNMAYHRPELVEAGVAFIDEGMQVGGKVLVHCNEGLSRGPSLALLALGTHVDEWRLPLPEARAKFEVVYPDYAPKAGIADYLAAHWPWPTKETEA